MKPATPDVPQIGQPADGWPAPSSTASRRLRTPAVDRSATRSRTISSAKSPARTPYPIASSAPIGARPAPRSVAAASRARRTVPWARRPGPRRRRRPAVRRRPRQPERRPARPARIPTNPRRRRPQSQAGPAAPAPDHGRATSHERPSVPDIQRLGLTTTPGSVACQLHHPISQSTGPVLTENATERSPHPVVPGRTRPGPAPATPGPSPRPDLRHPSPRHR